MGVGKGVLAEQDGHDDRGKRAGHDPEGGEQTPGCRRELAPQEREEGHRPLIVTTAVAPMRNGRSGSRSSSRMRTGNRLARRTQLRVRGTSGRTPTVAPW